MEVVPSRSYKLDVCPYSIKLEDVEKTLDHLKKGHKVYYTVYRVMLKSGMHFEQILAMIELWNPGEMIEISGTSIVTRRLVCFEDRGFCRYYMGLREGTKPCEWVYFSLNSLNLLQAFAPKHINRHQVRKYARRHGLILPKFIRKVS